MTSMTAPDDVRAVFEKVLHIGTCADGDVFIEVKWTGTRLSITGVEGPKRNGDARGGCGQIVYDAAQQAALSLAPGWDRTLIARLFEVWDRWHLNDVRAGSPRQSEFRRAHPDQFDVKYPVDHFANACGVLTRAGLNPDPEYLLDGEPYRYGSAWLHEDVPDDALAFLRGLPDTRKAYPWGNL